MDIESGINLYRDNEDVIRAKEWFSQLIQPKQYVGELYSINYESARVLVHDHERQMVSGIPSLCFLLATRVNPETDRIDFKDEDSSAIILRVLDSASLPNSTEAERIRVETAQRISGEINLNWDSDGVMDPKTRVYLGYAAIECRIIGTFFLDKDDASGQLGLKFGCDISNYYPNRGLKVYKPTDKALQAIVNYTDPVNLRDHEEKYGKTRSVKIGNIRYASTNRKYQDVDDVPVHIHPIDLLAQKTALFGMTRTGKSNTTKIIAKSVYDLRKPSQGTRTIRIGQLIFDPNGEYANENVQDSDGNDQPNALKNVWKSLSGASVADEVVTYGISPLASDPNRRMMLINFFDDEMLQTGKEILNTIIQNEDAKYMKNFYDVSFDYRPDTSDRSGTTRYNRRVLVYRALLKKAGFTPTASMIANLKGLFGQPLLAAMTTATHRDNDKTSAIRSASATLSLDNASWDALANAFEGLFYFFSTAAYTDFNDTYIRGSSTGEAWADAGLTSILEMFTQPKGARTLGRCIEQHSSDASSDFAEDIYNDLCDGKLVVVDQSVGEPEFNETVAKRVMWKIFRKNQAVFRTGSYPPDILVYIEEAHNLLPAGNDMDLKDIWVRAAKEGAKYRIGLIYATQEVSSIHKNILKNTSNWFISHLNNTDETRELCKFYDFADFEPSIRRAQDKGFLRVKTMSNFFVIPVQVDKFVISN
jgi:DNA helicase HerA-like ATPase